MSEEDNGISLKYDFENINKINYPHLSVRELIDIVGNEEPPEILKYIRENKLIIDTSQSVSESADLAFIFNAFFW